MERSDLDVPEETTIELGPGDQPAGTAAEPPRSLDPDRDQAERNAASGGWDGANEQIENDFEEEQLRRRQERLDDEDVTPLT